MLGKQTAVNWADLEPGRFEWLAAVLLSVLNPTVRRVDGAGGDEGCDVAFEDSDGLVIYELKSWTGRMAKRWAQLERSATRAVHRRPVRWVVVCPIDLTPAEERRLRKATAALPFDTDWLGKTWLDARLSENPALVRYFGSSHDEVVRFLGEIGQQQAALAGGISDASLRLQALADQLTEIDPFHDWSLTIGRGRVEVSRQARYLGADEDSPPRITAQFSFPATDEGRSAQAAFQRALDHGDPVEVTDEYVQGVSFENVPDSAEQSRHAVTFALGGDSNWDSQATLAIVDDLDLEELTDDTDVHATMPIRFGNGRGGQKSVRGTASDASGALTVTLIVDSDDGVSVSLSFDPSGVIPAATAPARALLHAVQPGRGVTIRFDDDQHTMNPILISESATSITDLADSIEELEILQQLTGRYFATPAGLTVEDRRDISEAVTLLLGGAVRETWHEMTLRGTAARILEQFEGFATGGRMVSIGEMSIEIGTHTIPLGVLSQTFSDASLRDPEALRTLALTSDPNDELDIVMVPRADAQKVTVKWSGGADALSLGEEATGDGV